MLVALAQSVHIPGYHLQMLDNYLKDCTLLYTTRERQRRKVIVSGGSPRIGSRAGPLECGLHSLLQIEMSKGTC